MCGASPFPGVKFQGILALWYCPLVFWYFLALIFAPYFWPLLDMVLSFDYPQFDPHEMRICPTLNKNAGPVRCISCVSTNSASGALKPCSTLRCMVKGVDIPGQPKFGAFKETFHMRNCSGVGLGQTPRPGVPGPEAGFGGSRQKLFGKCFLTACFLGGSCPWHICLRCRKLHAKVGNAVVATKPGGDHIVTINVRLPKSLDDEDRRVFQKLAAKGGV